MELDGASISAIGVIVTPVAVALGRAIWKDREAIVNQLRDCHKQHAADNYRIGSFESALSFMSSTQGPAVQERVERMLGEGREKAEEAKSTVPEKRK